MVLDLHVRRVIGWAMSAKPDADLAIKALDIAYEQRGKPQQVLFHSDSKNVLASVSRWPDPHSDRPLCLSPDLPTIREHCASR